MEQQIHKSSTKTYLIVGNIVLGCLFYGYAIAYLNGSIDTARLVFNFDEDQVKYVNTMVPFGALLGAIFTGPILTCMSRNKSLVLADFIGLIGVCCGLIQNLQALYIARLIIGVSVGLNSSIVYYFYIILQIPTYIKECTPTSLRGTAGSMNQISVNSGIQLAFLMFLGYADNTTLPYTDYWRIVFGLPGVFCIIRSIILLFVFNDEPPGYYISKGDEPKAVEVLEKMYIPEQVQEQLNELLKEQAQKSLSSTNYSDLFTPLYQKRFIIGCLLCVLQQFSGINAVIFYSNNIFQQITSDLTVQKILTNTVGVINLVFSILAGYLIKKNGRKTLLFFGCIMCFLCLLVLFILSYIKDQEVSKEDEISTLSILIIIFIFLFLIGFQLSLGPIVWIYIAETLPEKGVSLAVFINWGCVSIISFIFPPLQKQGIQYCFLLFSVCCFFGIILIHTMVKETKDKTSDQIDNMFSINDTLLGKNQISDSG